MSSVAFSKFTIVKGEDAKLNISGDLITGFQYSKTEGEDDYSSSFRSYRGRFAFAGAFKKKIKYKIRLRFQPVKADTDTNNSTFKLIDHAWVRYKISDYLKVKVGKFNPRPGVTTRTSNMHPITFASGDDGSLYNGTYALGMQLAGDLPWGHSWRFNVQNDIEKGAYRDRNQDNNYDIQLDLFGESDDEFKDKDLSGELRYTYGVNISRLAPLDENIRSIVAPFVALSAYNALFIAGVEVEKTTTSLNVTDGFLGSPDTLKRAYNVGAGYMFADFVRPSATLSIIDQEGEKDYIWAVNTTVFLEDKKFRPIFEYAMEVPAEGEKDHKIRAMISLDL